MYHRADVLGLLDSCSLIF